MDIFQDSLSQECFEWLIFDEGFVQGVGDDVLQSALFEG